MAKENKISMGMISRDVSKYEEVVKIEFEDTNEKGEKKEYTIKFYPYFDPQRITNLLERIKVDVEEMHDREDVDSIPDKLFPLFVQYHIAIEFSNLPKPRSKDISKRIAYFQELVRSKYFKMVDEHMLQDEFAKVWDRLLEILSASQKLEKMYKSLQDEIQNLDLKSPELRERLQGSKKRIPEA